MRTLLFSLPREVRKSFLGHKNVISSQILDSEYRQSNCIKSGGREGGSMCRPLETVLTGFCRKSVTVEIYTAVSYYQKIAMHLPSGNYL